MRANKVPNIKQNLAQVLKECIDHNNETPGSNDKAKYNKYKKKYIFRNV